MELSGEGDYATFENGGAMSPARSAILLAVIALIPACMTTPISADGARIQVTRDPGEVSSCEKLGRVEGADHMNGGFVGVNAAAGNAMNQMRNKAAKLGADKLLLLGGGANFGGADYAGDAYRCNSASLAK